MSTEEALYQTLQGRHMPGSVTPKIASMLAQHNLLDYDTKRMLDGVSSSYSYSLLPTRFRRPDSLVKLSTTLSTLTGIPLLNEESARDTGCLKDTLLLACEVIAADPSKLDFASDRLNRESREAHYGSLPKMSRRMYNKIFRIVSRLREEIRDLETYGVVCELARFAKTGFASKISYELFVEDIRSAAFVAYYTANLGRRSIFTSGKQARAFDSVAARLFDLATHSPLVCWDAIGMVFPKPDIYIKTSERFCPQLIYQSFEIMSVAAALMHRAVQSGTFKTDTMVVNRGDDSHTWNILAGAWNRARDYWLALMTACGLEYTFDTFLPGKAMRLMAADVAYWHRLKGGDVDADTKVWADLPKPWEVMSGQYNCNTQMIEGVCNYHKIDPNTTGWIKARQRTAVDNWRPTRDLAWGVEIANPEFASMLRRIGIFSGKRLKVRYE